MLDDIGLAENRLGQGLAGARRCGTHQAAAPDLPGWAVFEAQPFCEQWDIVQGIVPRSWQNKENTKSIKKPSKI